MSPPPRRTRATAAVLVTLLTALGASGAMAATAAPGSSGSGGGDRVVATFTDRAARGAALTRAGVPVQAHAVDPAAEGSSLGGRTAVLRLTPDQRRALADQPGVVAVEPDVRVRADRTPPDPAWNVQDGLREIDADAAWDLTTGSAAVTVAVVDTGIDSDQADFAGRLTAGWDFVNGDGDPEDDNGHGTAAASLIGAAANSRGIAGLCWTCRIMPLKALGSDGAGYLSDAALAIAWAVDHGADVVNLSLGAPGDSTALRMALQQAQDAGVLVVASAGNDGSTARQWPAADPRAVGVAALDGTARADYSNHGGWVDIAAPGCNPAYRNDGALVTFCGTSSSAPLVSGVAALVRAGAPDAPLAAQRAALTGTATPLGAGLGAGRVDADAAIADARATTVVPPPAGEPTDDPTSGPTPAPTDEPVLVPPSFTDIADSVHREAIEALAASGITTGCTIDTYCPARRVYRGQIATFLDRGLDLPDGTGRFADVPADHPHATGIAAVATAGITRGCTPDRYCPAASLTRGQMATLLTRGLGLPPGDGAFADVPADHPHAAGIAAVARAGITRGCRPDRYCPDRAVDRAQMASFLVRALDL